MRAFVVEAIQRAFLTTAWKPQEAIMGRSQTGGARDGATPSTQATVALHKRWLKRLKVLPPTFFHLLAWRSQLYFKCYRLLTAPLSCPGQSNLRLLFSLFFGIKQSKLFFSSPLLHTRLPQLTPHPPPPVISTQPDVWFTSYITCDRLLVTTDAFPERCSHLWCKEQIPLSLIARWISLFLRWRKWTFAVSLAIMCAMPNVFMLWKISCRVPCTCKGVIAVPETLIITQKETSAAKSLEQEHPVFFKIYWSLVFIRFAPFRGEAVLLNLLELSCV